MHNNIEAVDRTLKDLLRRSMSFGGKALLFLGDLRQILLVVPRSFEDHILASCFKRNSLFSLPKVLYLTTNMRLLAFQQNAEADDGTLAFPKYLSDVENGSPLHTEDYKIELPSSIKRSNSNHGFLWRSLPNT